MMEANADQSSNPKRNKPCENCRAHRRKCVVSDGAVCDRCRKTEQPCVFKHIRKPTYSRQSLSPRRRNMIASDVFKLEQEADQLEQELLDLCIEAKELQAVCTETDYGSSVSSLHGDESDFTEKRAKHGSSKGNSWIVTLSRSTVGRGLSIIANVNSVSDLNTILNRMYSHDDKIYRSPDYHADRSQHLLQITIPQLDCERFMRKLSSKHAARMPRRLQDSTGRPHLRSASMDGLKQHLMDTYWSCRHQSFPVLIRPYYEKRLRENLNSLLTFAVCALVLFSQCQHTHLDGLVTYASEDLAEAFYDDTRDMADDILFDDEPNVEIVFVLRVLTLCGALLLQNDIARKYSSFAWNIVIGLKTQYLPILQGEQAADPLEFMYAEMWRRMFYVIRLSEIHFSMSYDQNVNFTHVLVYLDFGLPTPLDSEGADQEEKRIVENYAHVMRITVLANLTPKGHDYEPSGFRVYSGAAEQVLLDDIELIEHQMIAFWYSLPVDYRISDRPIDYVQMEAVKRIHDPLKLRMNIFYYIFWLLVENRYMQLPQSTDLVGVTLSRVDADRALLIVSMSCDALSKLFKVLHAYSPCSIDYQWLSITINSNILLTHAIHPDIRTRARRNLESTLQILVNRMSSKYQPSTCLDDMADRSPSLSQTKDLPVAESPSITTVFNPTLSLSADVDNTYTIIDAPSPTIADGRLRQVPVTISTDDPPLFPFLEELKKGIYDILSTYTQGKSQSSHASNKMTALKR